MQRGDRELDMASLSLLIKSSGVRESLGEGVGREELEKPPVVIGQCLGLP